MTDSFDVVVLGTGSGGEAVAHALAAGGRSVAVIEERLVGGECPYLACMPSKAMLRAAALGWSWSDAVRFRDDVAEHRDDSAAVNSLRQAGVIVVRGHGLVTDVGAVQVGGREIGWRDLVIATGAAAVTPAVHGIGDVPHWTSDEALSSTERPARLAVLGGGPVGCELAQVYARFGTQVTLVEAAPRLLANEPAFVGGALSDALTADGVALHLAATLSHVTVDGGDVVLCLDDGVEVRADRLLVATGKRPRIQRLGLERLGIVATDDGAVPVDDRCRVIDHVWAVGDVTGVAPYTHTANYQAKVVAANIRGTERHADTRAIPRTVYTDPAVFCVGRTDADGALVTTSDVGRTARAAVAQREDGRVELYADPARRILVGAAVVGPSADEWAAELTLAVRAEVDVDMLADVVHAFPTFGEALEPAYDDLRDRLSGEDR